MVTAEECLLKADNYASAAMLVEDVEDARVLIRLAAIWRNRALRLKLAARTPEFLRPSVGVHPERW